MSCAVWFFLFARDLLPLVSPLMIEVVIDRPANFRDFVVHQKNWDFLLMGDGNHAGESMTWHALVVQL